MPSTSGPRERSAPMGSNRALANSFDMVGAVLAFFFIGFGLDHWLGTAPWFMIIFTLVGIFGSFARTWFTYSSEMDRLDAERRASRQSVAGPATGSDGSPS